MTHTNKQTVANREKADQTTMYQTKKPDGWLGSGCVFCWHCSLSVDADLFVKGLEPDVDIREFECSNCNQS